MNTAFGTYRVAHFGKYWIVIKGDETFTCRNQTQLVQVLSGGSLPRDNLPLPTPAVRKETVEEFLARGGKINRITFEPAPQPPPPTPERRPAAPSRVTLESLGLVFKPKPLPEKKE